MAQSFSEARADRKRSRRLANLQALMMGFGVLGQGLGRFGQAQSDKQKAADEQARYDAGEPQRLATLDLTKARVESEQALAASRSAASSDPFNSLSQGYQEGAFELQQLMQETGSRDLESLRGAIQTKKFEEMSEIDNSLNAMKEMGLDTTAMGPEIMQRQQAVEDKYRKMEMLLQENPNVQSYLQHSAGKMPLPAAQAPGLSPGSPPASSPLTPQPDDPMMQWDPWRRGGQQAPGMAPPPRGGTLPGMAPGESEGDFMASLPQGPGATPADRNFLGEFGQLWRTALDRHAPVEEQMMAWNRLRDYRVQPPYWVQQAAQGLGGNMPA